MKKIWLAILIASTATLTGCATPYPMGAFFTNETLPVHATSIGGRPHKVGTSECKSYFSLFATGDCSIESAKTNGGISKVHHIDWEIHNIIGISTYKVVVYGE